jgi:hypothetical protein
VHDLRDVESSQAILAHLIKSKLATTAKNRQSFRQTNGKFKPIIQFSALRLLSTPKVFSCAASPLQAVAEAGSGMVFFDAWQGSRWLDTHRKPMGATGLH